ncbi:MULTISPECIES: MFS transporter [unclassified Rathayibacter]|uniref:MFS transporter n=1 Tax=unclassified Rathayibacter TaxID=2609250 RepID=UPI000CE81E8B|nr:MULTISPECIES: MFS transporter [unclassified Rathayibacter]PPG04768.1 MFS transporter [Rathayibacter sp. AY2B1]PPG68465.1 MFS transporter [Rathayibacter sp. AY1F4]
MSTTGSIETVRPLQSGGVIALMGLPYLALALVARLPFTMMIVGTLTLLVERGETVAVAGIISAVAGIGTAVSAPVVGRLVERFGQRAVLLGVGAVFLVALLLFVGLVAISAPLWSVGTAALAAGLASPQVAPMSRSRVTAKARRVGLASAQLDRAMGYESMADEGAFVVGPVLVGVFSVLLGPFAPLLGAAGLTATAVIGFALHRSAAARTDPLEGHEFAPTRFVNVRFIVLVSGMVLVGGIFGTTLTALTSELELQSMAEWTGLVYGVMSIGSIISAAAISRIPGRFLPRRLRWVVTAVLALAGLAVMAVSPDLPLLTVGLLILGLGVGASLVSIFSFAAESVPGPRHTSAFAILASSLVVSQAVLTAGAGVVVTGAGPDAGFALGAVLGLLLVVAGIVDWRLVRGRQAAPASHASH